MKRSAAVDVRIKVVGVGGAGGNAIVRMAGARLQGLEYLAINTDVQALERVKGVATFAIGPTITGGMGSGGNADVGRKAIKESQGQVARLLEDTDMVFVAAGMGGGTGTGAAPLIAEIARKQGALTVAVVTSPFSFEGLRRREIAERGRRLLEQKADTLINVENDELLSSLDGRLSLDKAFQLADEVLQQGVKGVSEIVTTAGLINVDFADVRTVMANAGRSFMAMGEGRGKSAAIDAVRAALASPLFDAPLRGASAILLNVKGGKDLELAQVHQVAEIVRQASHPQANVVFGVVNEPKWKKRVGVTLVATGSRGGQPPPPRETPEAEAVAQREQVSVPVAHASSNGRAAVAPGSHKLL